MFPKVYDSQSSVISSKKRYCRAMEYLAVFFVSELLFLRLPLLFRVNDPELSPSAKTTSNVFAMLSFVTKSPTLDCMTYFKEEHVF